MFTRLRGSLSHILPSRLRLVATENRIPVLAVLTIVPTHLERLSTQILHGSCLRNSDASRKVIFAQRRTSLLASVVMHRMPPAHRPDLANYPFPPGPAPEPPVLGHAYPLRGMGMTTFEPPPPQQQNKWVMPLMIAGVAVLGGAAIYFAMKAHKAHEERLDKIIEKEGVGKALAYEAGETGLRILDRMSMRRNSRSAKKAKAVTKSYLQPNKKAAPKKTSARKKSLKDACWDGYTAVGHKEKKGRKVPNCVPSATGVKPPKARRAKRNGDSAPQTTAPAGDQAVRALVAAGEGSPSND